LLLAARVLLVVLRNQEEAAERAGLFIKQVKL
jgi:hypothetical protein